MAFRKFSDSSMHRVVVVALALLLLIFLLPMLFLRGERSLAAQTPAPTGTLPLNHTVVSTPPSPSPQPAASIDAGATVRVKLPDGSVAVLSMADYLWRVVAAEMPASFELEALKAQAVAARTYARAKMGTVVAAHPDADVCTDINCCQAYIDPLDAQANWGGSAPFYEQKIRSAVTATDGLIALYDGAPIQAVFFSSAAGRTVDAVEVWGNAVPYLTGVESPEGEEVPNYHSEVTVPLEEFRQLVLSQAPDADLSGDCAGWISNVVLNSAGGVASAELGGVSFRGSDIRTLFALRSANFTATADADGVHFSVTGYGHGVGMSQYGANALAKAGKSCEEILQWYYTGISLAPLG